MNLTCTIIKLGRSDEFGRPFTLNQVYTGPYEYVRDLYTSGFAAVADPAVFDGGAPYTPMTPVEVDALTALAEDISTDSNGNPTIAASIVPRHDTQAVLDTIPGTQYEIMYAEDTKRFGVMSGDIGIPHTYLGLASGTYGASLVAGTFEVLDATGPVTGNLVISTGDFTLDGEFDPCVDNLVIHTGAPGLVAGSNIVSVGCQAVTGTFVTAVGVASNPSSRGAVIGFGNNGTSYFHAESSSAFTTTDATPAVVPTQAALELKVTGTCEVEIVVIAKNASAAGAACYRRRVLIQNQAGTHTILQTITLGTDYTAFAGFAPPAPTIAIDASGYVLVTVTGLAATTIQWSVTMTGVANLG